MSATAGAASSVEEVSISVDFTLPLGKNNLTIGTHFEQWMGVNRPVMKEMAHKADFRVIRIFTSYFEPCVYWDERTHGGSFNWTMFDDIIRTIYEIGAEPLVCINLGPDRHPKGMYIDPKTKLPSVESIVNYSSTLASHAKEKLFDIHYWEILNEPQQYVFNLARPDPAAIAFLVNLFNAVAGRIHSILPHALCGTDASNVRKFLNYFVAHGRGVGFLSFHKYDAHNGWWNTDEQVLRLASSGSTWPRVLYTPLEMRQIWKSVRGEELPVICSETNLNSAWEQGTDPRIQQPIGAVWYAEEIRSFALMGVRYSTYYAFTSSKAWEDKNKQTGGWGFGMVDLDDYTEWYPYLINYLIGNNLKYGDPIFQVATTNFTKVSAFAWKNDDRYLVLLINKANRQVRVRLEGVAGGSIFHKLDSSDQWSRPKIEIGAMDPAEPLIMNGYSVNMLATHASAHDRGATPRAPVGHDILTGIVVGASKWEPTHIYASVTRVLRLSSVLRQSLWIGGTVSEHTVHDAKIIVYGG